MAKLGIKKRNKTFFLKLQAIVITIFLKVLIGFVGFFNIRQIQKLADILGSIAYYVPTKKLRSALENMEFVYGQEKTTRELKEILKKNLKFSSRCMCDMAYCVAKGKITTISDLLDLSDLKEKLPKFAANKQGAIAISAHLGNFMLLGGLLNAVGYKNKTIIRPMRNPFLEKEYIAVRKTLNHDWVDKFPVSKAIKEGLDWVQSGGMLILLIDQRSKSGVEIKFLGKNAIMPKGASVFASKTGCKVFPMFAVLEKNHYKIIVGDEIPLVRTGNFNEDAVANTENFTKVIEKYIKKYPEQWFWFNRIWQQ